MTDSDGFRGRGRGNPTLGCGPLQKNDVREIRQSHCEQTPQGMIEAHGGCMGAGACRQSMRAQAKAHMQPMVWSALNAYSRGLSKAVPSVSFGGGLGKLRPVYTSFTPGLGGGGASRAFASRAFGCAAPSRAKACRCRHHGPVTVAKIRKRRLCFFPEK